jgi:hypothetical protein
MPWKVNGKLPTSNVRSPSRMPKKPSWPWRPTREPKLKRWPP